MQLDALVYQMQPNAVTKIWSIICPQIKLYKRTLTRRNNVEESDEKSRQCQISWWTCHDKLIKDCKMFLPSNNVMACTMVACGAMSVYDHIVPRMLSI